MFAPSGRPAPAFGSLPVHCLVLCAGYLKNDRAALGSCS
ncbi:unnamed protein product [Amoebophrya sp. A120]|nr:unnamed protein product [Amoebophrya sp. A120]|eukprot:GSA120T00011669001.1